jgi:predicted lipoprotein with Yx(FWY)xxD motif
MRISAVNKMSRPVRLAAGVGGAAGVALLAAACSSGSSGSAAASSPASGSTAAGGTVITTATSSGSTFLTDGSGRAVYLWAKDSGNASQCSGACAGTWPPVTTASAPTASGSAKTAELGTITRSDGTKQVTYDMHPLYYFAGDSGAGTATGQGSDSFGAKWWLVSPAGGDVTASVSSFTVSSGSGASTAPSQPATGYSNSGGGY